MRYAAQKCRCGQLGCSTWYVTLQSSPEPIRAWSERQVGVVVNAINALEDYPDGVTHTDTHLDGK